MKTEIAMLLATVAILSGCEKAEHRPLFEASAAKAAAFDSRTLLDFARELAIIEKGYPYDADEGYAELTASFQGKRYRWELFLIPELCTESQCNALPFRDGGKADGVVAGWMPRLAIASETRAQLLARCEGEPQCPFVVEATLAELTASTENFTSLRLEDVTLVAAR